MDDLATILISPNGDVYYLQHNNWSIRWRYKMQPPSSFMRQNMEAKQYLDADVDDVGSIHLFHKVPPSEVIDISGQDLDQYLKNKFVDEVVYNSCYVNEVNLDPKDGGYVDRVSSCIKIKREQHIMLSSTWRLEYSKFCASRIHDDESQPTEMNVWHTLTKEKFIHVCRKVNSFQDSNGATLRDLNLHNEFFKMNRIEIPSPMVPIIPGYHNLVEGLFNGFQASIHRPDDNIHISRQYQVIMQLNMCRHDNILGFYGADMDESGNYRFAFEECNQIQDHFSQFNMESKVDVVFLNLMSGIVHGLKHLHSLELAHGKMSPWNVMVGDIDNKKSHNATTKLWELNDCTVLSDDSRYLDYINLAKLITYCYSDPPSTISKDCYLKQNLSRSSYNQMYRLAYEAKDVVKYLTYNGKKITHLNHVVAHPWLWTYDKRLGFLKVVNELLAAYPRPAYIRDIEDLADECWDTSHGWDKRFKIDLYDLMKNRAQKLNNPYNVNSVCSLIRFMRNLYCNFFQIGDDLSRKSGWNYLGNTYMKLEYKLRKAFPKLLTLVYNELLKQGVTLLGYLSYD